METPTREELARWDRKRKKRTSNKDGKSPADADARIAKMKDGRTHLAHQAEHAVDLDTGAVVAVTLQGADKGDTTTLEETLCEAGMAVAEQVEREAELRPDQAPKVNVTGIEETVTDKGYHSGAVVKRMKAYEVRSYIPEKKRKGRRNWAGKQAEQQAVYANRRRVRGEYGKSLLRRRGELVERSFAHCYETGAMRRCHLRGQENILKRQLIHVGAFNLSLILRKLLGYAAGVEEPLRQACFDPLLTLPVSDKSEAALQKPNLCVRCQVLHEIAYPTTSPDLQETRYLHPGLLWVGRRPMGNSEPGC
jgi:transposase